MSACERFEQEALLLLEQGQPLSDDHFATCPDCLAARAAYERLRADLAEVGQDALPRPDWQARVRQRIEERRRPKARLWLWMVPSGLAAALLAVVLLWPAPPAPPGITVAVEKGNGPVRRGVEAQPGDRLVLRATTGGARHAELRVYKNDLDLVFHCTEATPCERSGRTISATVVLETVGTYQSLLLTSASPIPAPAAGSLDVDAGVADQAGAHVELGEEVTVW